MMENSNDEVGREQLNAVLKSPVMTPKSPRKVGGSQEGHEVVDAKSLSMPEVMKRIIAIVGGIAQAAELLGTSQSTICRWKDGDAHPRDPKVEDDMRSLINGATVDPDLVAKYTKSPGALVTSNHKMKRGVIESIERGMAASKFISKGHKVAGINKHDYAILYKMVALRDHRGTPINDRERIIHLLNTVDQERSCSPHRVEMREIIERNWSRLMVKKERHVVKREKERFDMTIINVGEVCSSMSEMAVPFDLSDIQRDASISTLMSSIANITDLVSRLVGEKDTSHD
jgi:hypothetical protein